MEKFNEFKIHQYPISKENVVFKGNSLNIYKITFLNGKKDLVRILGEDLYVNFHSILTDKGYKLSHKDFIEMINDNRVEDLDVKII